MYCLKPIDIANNNGARRVFRFWRSLVFHKSYIFGPKFILGKIKGTASYNWRDEWRIWTSENSLESKYFNFKPNSYGMNLKCFESIFFFEVQILHSALLLYLSVPLNNALMNFRPKIKLLWKTKDHRSLEKERSDFSRFQFSM